MLFNSSWSFHRVHEQKLTKKRKHKERERRNNPAGEDEKRRCRGNHTSMTISCAMWKAAASHPPPSSAKTAVSGPKARTSLRFILLRSSFWINLLRSSLFFWFLIGSDDSGSAFWLHINDRIKFWLDLMIKDSTLNDFDFA